MLAKMGKFFSKSKPKHRSNSLSNYDYQNSGGVICDNSVMSGEREQAIASIGADSRTPVAVHSEAASSVVYVEPGVCVSGSKDTTVILYDYNKGKILQRWEGHDREVTKVAYGAKIQSYFSASRDKNISLWHTGSLEPVLQFRGHELVVNGLAMNDENNVICSGSRDNSMRLWDVHTGHCTLQKSVTRNLVTHVYWAPGTNMIAQTGEDKELKIWDAHSLTITQTFIRKQYIQNWCDMSADGNYCITCSNGFQGNGCEATLWDLRTSKIVREYKGHMECVGATVFLSDNHYIATCSSDCSVRVWERDTGECVCVTPLPGSGPLTSLAVCEDNKLAVSSFNTGIHILQANIQSGRLTLKHVSQY